MEEKKNWKPIIYNNVLLGMQTVIKDGVWGLEIPDVADATSELATQLMDLGEDQPLDAVSVFNIFCCYQIYN